MQSNRQRYKTGELAHGSSRVSRSKHRIIPGAMPLEDRPIDLVHLAKQTMGDKALEIEVLQMFARQARACLQEHSSAATQRRSTPRRTG